MKNTHQLPIRLFAGLFALALIVVLVLPFATGLIGAATASLDGFSGVAAGASVKGVVSIQAQVSGTAANVAFLLSGPASKSFIDRSAPFFFNGDTQGTPVGWDTTTVPDGAYTLRATLTDSTGARQVKTLAFTVANAAQASVAVPVYTDQLGSSWINWSWDASLNPASTTTVHSGSAAMAVAYSAAWGGFYLHTDGLAVSDSSSVSLWVHGGGVANRQISLAFMDATGTAARTQALTIPANAWSQVVAPLGAAFPTGKLTGIVLQEHGGAPQSTFYVDDLSISASSPPAQPQPTVQPTSLPIVQPTAIPQPATQPQPTAIPQPTTQPAPAGGFLATFDGDPTSPQPFNPSNWDVAVHSRDVGTWYQLETMQAMHGADCAGPPATHTVSRYEDAVFQCRNHVMTAIQAGGYGVIYLTPNQMADFSGGEAVVRWDMSTLRTSLRDWADIWITPYDTNLSMPFDDAVVDLSGPPQNAVNIRMDLARNSFYVTVYRNFVATTIQGDNWTTYDTFLTPDAARRDTFELGLSRTHVRFGMPAYGFRWVDADIPDLGWSQGVVQFGHHSYNPLKLCPTCTANTWHWDNVSISPAKPFTIVKADRRYADRAAPTITLAQAAPAGASLRFAGIGPNIEVSFDGGKTWQAAKTQAQNAAFFKDEHFRSYWMPIPAGTTQVQFRGQVWWGADWHAQDISVWSR